MRFKKNIFSNCKRIDDILIFTDLFSHSRATRKFQCAWNVEENKEEYDLKRKGWRKQLILENSEKGEIYERKRIK